MPRERIVAAARHSLCVLALMWMAVVNGQPFFFQDTTSYVRAADAAVYLASHGRVATAWTSRYQKGADTHLARQPAAHAAAAPAAKAAGTAPALGNDLSSGSVMSGRSPYFGALLYLGYVTSQFWLFVIAQAATAYALLILTLRHFGLDRPKIMIGVVALLAVGTGLPYFDGLLMPDALAAFGILAYLLVITDRGAFGRPAMIFLWLVMIVSAVSHLTHIFMLLAMLIGVSVAKLAGWAAPRRSAVLAGLAAVVVGLLSVTATSAVTKAVFKKPPQLVPLMTARFIADGPGADFIRADCGGRAFTVCSLPLHAASSTDFLWSNDPRTGTFLVATPAQRARLSAEDTRFALAVLKAYPLRQGGQLVFNTLRQAAWFPAKGLNMGCFAEADCWASLPPKVREKLRDSPSGRSLFPVKFITGLQYAVVVAALCVFAARIQAVTRKDRRLGHDLILWMLLFIAAMLTCDALGGGISEPQFRYQGRIIWLIPLLGVLVGLLDRTRSPAVDKLAADNATPR